MSNLIPTGPAYECADPTPEEIAETRRTAWDYSPTDGGYTYRIDPRFRAVPFAEGFRLRWFGMPVSYYGPKSPALATLEACAIEIDRIAELVPA